MDYNETIPYDIFDGLNFYEQQGDAAMDVAILEYEGKEMLLRAANRLFGEMCSKKTGSPEYEYLLAGWLWIDDFLEA